MLNLISMSLCGVLTCSVGLVAQTTPMSEQFSVHSATDSTLSSEPVTQQTDEQLLALSDSDGGASNGDRRGAGRRN